MKSSLADSHEIIVTPIHKADSVDEPSGGSGSAGWGTEFFRGVKHRRWEGRAPHPMEQSFIRHGGGRAAALRSALCSRPVQDEWGIPDLKILTQILP